MCGSGYARLALDHGPACQRRRIFKNDSHLSGDAATSMNVERWLEHDPSSSRALWRADGKEPQIRRA
jgi:hypothetical protein